MKNLEPATHAQETALEIAIDLLQKARQWSKIAQTPKLTAQIGSALKSADGARRHMQRRIDHMEERA
jgi:hypothetical protein